LREKREGGVGVWWSPQGNLGGQPGEKDLWKKGEGIPIQPLRRGEGRRLLNPSPSDSADLEER